MIIKYLFFQGILLFIFLFYIKLKTGDVISFRVFFCSVSIVSLMITAMEYLYNGLVRSFYFDHVFVLVILIVPVVIASMLYPISRYFKKRQGL